MACKEKYQKTLTIISPSFENFKKIWTSLAKFGLVWTSLYKFEQIRPVCTNSLIAGTTYFNDSGVVPKIMFCDYSVSKSAAWLQNQKIVPDYNLINIWQMFQQTGNLNHDQTIPSSYRNLYFTQFVQNSLSFNMGTFFSFDFWPQEGC